MKLMRWAVDSQFHVRVAPRAPVNLLPPALIHRTVTKEPKVGFNEVTVLFDNLRQVDRSGLFLAFEKESDVRSRLYACIQRREKCLNGRFVIGRASGE